MSLHRAVVSLLAAFLITCWGSPGNATFAATTNYLYVAHTTAATVQNSGVESVIVYRNGSASGAASVLCKTANDTAISGRDFTAVSTTLHWASGESTPQHCNVPLSDATPFTGSRVFFVELSDPTGDTLSSANKVAVTIFGNKGGGTVSVASPTYTVAQSAGKVTISVNRAGGSVGSAVVYYATANVSAIAGTNYTSASGQLDWANGDATAKSFSIPISDAKPFSGTKTLAVAIAHPINVELGSSSSAIVTIDGSTAGAAKPTVTISATPTTVESDQSPSLKWTVTNATTCTASGGWSGLMPTSGTLSPAPITETTTYTLGCTGSGGSTTQSATVSVGSPSAPVTAAACPVTSGPLTLRVSAVRSTGVSPFLMFFDATGTTDTSTAANTRAFQNVTYRWNFGDTGASGTSTWAYGSNPGKNSKNTATGGIAAHLYVTSGTDTAYKATVTATDGTNTASCQVPVTAHDPSGANGFPSTATTCVSSSGTPVAGSGGCPAGAAVLRQSSAGSAWSSNGGSNKRVLFQCGDTFSGGISVGVGTTKSTIGAYGSCENTSSDRPILTNTGGGNAICIDTGGSTYSQDIRIADIDFEGNGTGNNAISTCGGGSSGIAYTVNQLTLYNLYSNGLKTSYYTNNSSQSGIIQSVMTGMGSIEGVYWNYAANNCVNGSAAYNCGGTPNYVNVNYNAMLGNSFNGRGATGNTWETERVSACRLCVFENNLFENGATPQGGATLKIHSGDTFNSANGANAWLGQYTEYLEISDNVFTGTSGYAVEIAPQNSQYDERIRNVVFERNIVSADNQVVVSGQNMSIRDNVFNQTVHSPIGLQTYQRAPTAPSPGTAWPTQYLEIYNNTCYGGTCIENSSAGGVDVAHNSAVQNNLCYTGTCVSFSSGTGNTVSNNTSNTALNPGWTNGSGQFDLISDFKPTANYTGGISVPVWYDALGTPISSIWILGAVQPSL
jgi:Calx-beta domain